MTWVTVVDGVEDQFDASGDAEFFENPVEIFFDGVLAEVEFAGDLTISQAFGDEGDDLFLAWGEERGAHCVQDAERGDFRNQIDDVVELFSVGPDLSRGNSKKAFAEQAQIGIGDRKNSARARPKGTHHKFTIAGVDEKHLWNLRVREMKTSQRDHGFGGVGGRVQ